jgi:hypothetical protein
VDLDPGVAVLDAEVPAHDPDRDTLRVCGRGYGRHVDLPEPTVVVVCVLAVVAGAAVQGVLGFGLALVSVPVLAWVVPSVVPVAILVSVLPLVVVAALREWSHVDLRGLAVAFIGRVPGGALGAAAVALLPVRGLQLVVAATVLAAVGVTGAGDALRRRSDAPGRSDRRPSAPVLVAAGAASGLGGTAAGIGGPPMALAYRGSGGATLRATLSAFFLVGSLVSLGMLAVAGEVTAAALLAGLAFIPAVGLGYLLAEPMRHRLQRRGVRAAVLGFSALAAAALAVRALTGAA